MNLIYFFSFPHLFFSFFGAESFCVCNAVISVVLLLWRVRMKWKGATAWYVTFSYYLKWVITAFVPVLMMLFSLWIDYLLNRRDAVIVALWQWGLDCFWLLFHAPIRTDTWVGGFVFAIFFSLWTLPEALIRQGGGDGGGGDGLGYHPACSAVY